MKKYINSSDISMDAVHLSLEIIAVLDESVFSQISVAAAKHNVGLEYRDLPADWQLTDKELSIYRSFIISMASIIASYGFDIVDEYQSEESYSYYIQFTPTLHPGVLDNTTVPIPMKQGTDLLLDVKIRLSNHYVSGEPIKTDSIARSISAGAMFKEYVVAGIRHDDINSALVDLQEVCQSLQLGDYSRLLG